MVCITFNDRKVVTAASIVKDKSRPHRGDRMAQTMSESQRKKRERVLESQRQMGAVPKKSHMIWYAVMAVAATFLIVAAMMSVLGHS